MHSRIQPGRASHRFATSGRYPAPFSGHLRQMGGPWCCALRSSHGDSPPKTVLAGPRTPSIRHQWPLRTSTRRPFATKGRYSAPFSGYLRQMGGPVVSRVPD